MIDNQNNESTQSSQEKADTSPVYSDKIEEFAEKAKKTINDTFASDRVEDTINKTTDFGKKTYKKIEDSEFTKSVTGQVEDIKQKYNQADDETRQKYLRNIGLAVVGGFAVGSLIFGHKKKH